MSSKNWWRISNNVEWLIEEVCQDIEGQLFVSSVKWTGSGKKIGQSHRFHHITSASFIRHHRFIPMRHNIGGDLFFSFAWSRKMLQIVVKKPANEYYLTRSFRINVQQTQWKSTIFSCFPSKFYFIFVRKRIKCL